MEQSPVEIVVFGGSFDPPHIAHSMAIVFALSVRPEATLFIIPTYRHAFEKDFGASYAQRMQMCEMAFSCLARTHVSAVESEIGGTSRTLRTLEALQQQHPTSTFRLLIGADILAERDKWHRFDEVERIAPPLVIGRPGYPSDAPFTLPGISSTKLRSDLTEKRNVEGRMATNVIDFVRDRKLYDGGANG